MTTATAFVRTKIQDETNSGNRKGWSKLVSAVNLAKEDGYAFDGVFLTSGKEYDLEVGSVIVQQHPEGSVKHGYKSGHCYTLDADGDLCHTGVTAKDWYKDFLSFRDGVARVVAGIAADGYELWLLKFERDGYVRLIDKHLPLDQAESVRVGNGFDRWEVGASVPRAELVEYYREQLALTNAKIAGLNLASVVPVRKAIAVAQIKKLMAEENLTVADLEG